MSPKEEIKSCLEWEKGQKELENIPERNENTAPREIDVDVARSYEETLAKRKHCKQEYQEHQAVGNCLSP